MKVVFCAYDGKDIINGVNAWLIRLLPRLAENGIEVSVIFIIWAPEKDCTTIPLLRAEGIKCTVIPTAHYTGRLVKWILKHLTDINADVFVPGNMIPAFYASRWAKDAGIATIGVLHSDNQESRAVIDEFIMPHSNSLTAVVPVSQVLATLVKNSNATITVRQIPCGAPVAAKKASIETGKPFKIIYVGRVAKDPKRIDEITKAFCICAQNLPNTEYYIYGSGPDTNIVEETLAAYNNPTNVFRMGSIPPAQIQDVLLSSHVIVLMSDYEGFPVALMEGMGCGVVPVCKATDSGIPELVTDGVTGFLIENYTQLADKVNYLQNNPDVWEEISASCKTLISRSFSSDSNAADWTKLLIDQSGGNKKKISIPFRLKLPKSNPEFGDADRREPMMIIKALRKVKRTLKL